MSNWKVIVPIATENLCTNPSFETGTTGWSTGGTNTIAQSSTHSKFGVYSVEFTYSDNASMVAYSITLGGVNRFVASAWVYIPTGTTIDDKVWIVPNFGGNATVVSRVQWDNGTDPFDTWFYLECVFDMAAGAHAGNVEVESDANPPGGTANFWVDAMLIEDQSAATTYCDGDQPGCRWLGAEHASKSTRSGITRAGGTVYDLKDDYSFGVKQAIGVGTAALNVIVDEYAALPGGQSNTIRRPTRVFTLVGSLYDRDEADCDLHAVRQALHNILAHDTYPAGDDGWQPVLLRFVGAAVDKEIAAHYESGLEASLDVENVIHEIVPVRFRAEDPMWYEIGDSSMILDTSDSTTYDYIAARLGVSGSGQWNDLGSTGTGTVYAVVKGRDNLIYIGGDFVNWDTIAAADYFAQYDPDADSWAAVGPAGTFDAAVRGIAVAPNGDLYAVGDFTTGGGAVADHVARWDGTNWNAVGNPLAAPAAITTVDGVAIDQAGDVYVTGDFTDFAGNGASDYHAKWDVSGAAWSAVSTALNGRGYVVAIDKENQPWFGGAFTQDGGAVDLRHITYYDGTAWVEPGGGLNANVYAMDFADDNTLYIGGNFTQNATGTVTGLNYITQWNGTIYSTLGDGLESDCFALEIAPDGRLWVGGQFDEAGPLTTADALAIWTGKSWLHVDSEFNTPGTLDIRTIAVGAVDPTISSIYDLYVGFSVSRVCTFAGSVTVTNDGTAAVFPVIRFNQTGGRYTLISVRNETTGDWLFLDHELLDGETVTIDTNPQAKSVMSSFRGKVQEIVLAGSDFGAFSLIPGANTITCHIRVGAADTLIAYMLWRDTYAGLD